MNGYDAQDMATQGAEGFRNGYQSGYADAVKAVEVGKPAAAQEAVYQLRSTDDDRAWVDCTEGEFNWWQGRSRESRKLFAAAPVAAAPVDLIERCAEIIAWQKTGVLTGNALRAYADARWPDEHAKLQIAENETAREAYRILSVATATSTPAAPGIDPADPWRGLYAPELMPTLDGVNDWIASHPNLPQWPDDEERGIDNLIKAQGFAFSVVSDEYPDDAVASGVEFDTCAWLADWKPESPAGEHWRLVMIQDTEDGPAAVYVRPLALADASPKGGSSPAPRFELTNGQIAQLADFAGTPVDGAPLDEQDVLVIQHAEAVHSGPGLYAHYDELPEEGAIYLDGQLPDSPKGDSDVQSWKLLSAGEVIRRGDQILNDDCATWGELVGWEVGLPYNPTLHVPMRRAQATSAEVGS